MMLLYSLLLIIQSFAHQSPDDSITYITTADKITFHYKHGTTRYGYINYLVKEDPSIKFAMNGAMYAAESFAPVGLYIEKGKMIHRPVIINNSSTNFGINPQAVFFINKKGKAGLVDIKEAKSANYFYAVEIAPMLIQHGKINPVLSRFNGKTKRRNGIGLTKEGKIVFLLARKKTSFTEFAQLMKEMGCVDAAYVDGGISDTWTPGKESFVGEFGVIIAAH